MIRIPKTTGTRLSVSRDAWAWMLWVVFVLVVSLKKGLDPLAYANVYPVYRDSGLHWLKGLPLYDGSGFGFVYLPQFAALFAPLALLPDALGNLLWRLINTGMFAWGVYGFSRIAEQRFQTKLFLPVTFVVISLSTSSAKLGQATILVSGMMMLALLNLTRENWNRGAGWLVASFAFKPLSIVLIPLVAVLYPKTRVPFIVAFAVLLCFPFLLQNPDYVWTQYEATVNTLRQVAAVDGESSRPYAQLFWAIKVLGFATPENVQLFVRVSFALLTLWLCWWLRGKESESSYAIYLFTLAICYLMLFNPRTENNTYAMLAPSIGVFTAWSFQFGRHTWRYIYLAIVAMYVFSYQIGVMFTGAPTIWIKPLLCIAFLCAVLVQWRLEHAGPLETTRADD